MPPSPGRSPRSEKPPVSARLAFLWSATRAACSLPRSHGTRLRLPGGQHSAPAFPVLPRVTVRREQGAERFPLHSHLPGKITALVKRHPSCCLPGQFKSCRPFPSPSCSQRWVCGALSVRTGGGWQPLRSPRAAAGRSWLEEAGVRHRCHAVGPKPSGGSGCSLLPTPRFSRGLVAKAAGQARCSLPVGWGGCSIGAG